MGRGVSFFILTLISLSIASDVPCTSSGGNCQYTAHTCSGGSYHTGLCSGAVDRQCCVSGDAACVTAGGHCQEDSNACSGTYDSGLCSGHASRRCCVSGSSSHVSQTVDCTSGSHRYNARGTAYYPADDPIEGGFYDMRGQTLKTLQDFPEGRASYVSVAMDNRAGIPYGTHVCIPQMNAKYHRVIDFRVVDTGSAFYGKGYSRIDICVRTQSDSFNSVINNHLTLVFP